MLQFATLFLSSVDLILLLCVEILLYCCAAKRKAGVAVCSGVDDVTILGRDYNLSVAL